MAAIFAQVHGDAISTRGLTRKRESDAVWFDLIAVIKGVLAITSLPDSRDMIDVDSENGSTELPYAEACHLVM